MTNGMTTVTTRDYNLLVDALKAIKHASFFGSLEAAREGRWHEYAARLQQIAHNALVNTLEEI